MKILVISNYNPMNQSNASSNRFMSLAQGLSKNNIAIDFLFLKGYLNKKEFIEYKKSGSLNNYNYKYLFPKFQRNRIIKAIFHRLMPEYLYAQKIKEEILNNKYDYVWIRFNSIAIKTSLLIFKYNLPVKYFHEQSEYSWIGLEANSKLHEKYLNIFLPNIDLFSIMTSKLIDYYKKYTFEKTKIVHLPMTVDFSRFDKGENETKLMKPYIAYCGTMNNKKDGVDILIKSFIYIMYKHPNYHLYLAGNKFPKADYEQLILYIKKHRAQERVTFLGEISKEEIPSFLQNASILALSRPNSKQAEGGFPTKLGEYLATSNPVCVTNVGEIGKYLENNISAYIAESGSVESFSSVLESAINNPEAIDIGKRGREIAFKKFNMNVQAKILTRKLLDTLNKV